MASFTDLGLSSPILKALQELGFEQPTPIQEKVIPLLVQQRQNLVGIAQTGTGKTAAFGLPVLMNVAEKQKLPQALILSPTRELGQQIAEQLKKFCAYKKGVRIEAVYGGAPISKQIRAIKSGVEIIIATPGRLVDLINRKAVNLSEVDIVVLDEADEMLNMGFKDDLDAILDKTPSEKRTWLFSATMPKEIKKIVNRHIEDHAYIKVSEGSEVNKDIHHQYVRVSPRNKIEALCRYVESTENLHAVVFCRTRRDTQALADQLLKRSYAAGALHGDLSQAQRDKVMDQFRSGVLQLLIATDVAARGIDVDNLSHVFHFNLPDDLTYYTHRSGRTARAGKKGVSLSFVSNRDVGQLNRLRSALKIDIQKVEVPQARAVLKRQIENWFSSVVSAEGELDKKIYKQIKKNLGDFTKEELIAQTILWKINDIGLDSLRDLNDYEKDPPPSSKRRNQRSHSRGGGSHKSKRSSGRRKDRKETQSSSKPKSRNKKRNRRQY